MTASWPVFVRRLSQQARTTRGANPRRDDEEARVLRLIVTPSHAPPEQKTVAYHAEAGRTARSAAFPFSAFKRALCVVAARLQPELRPPRIDGRARRRGAAGPNEINETSSGPATPARRF